MFMKEKERISKIFHENTKILDDTIYEKEKNNDYVDEWKRINFKTYPRMKNIILKNPEIQRDLEKIIIKRRSIRDFELKKLSFNDLSELLICSFGITEKPENWNDTKRAYPSAGARYPIEVYVVIFNVENLKNGIYHYNVKSNSLERLVLGDFRDKIVKYTNEQEWIRNASMAILFTAVFDRNQIKYGERGYRYVLLDAGHMAQNVYLISTAMNLGCCTIGGFHDNKINKLLDVNENKENIVYIAIVGVPLKK